MYGAHLVHATVLEQSILVRVHAVQPTRRRLRVRTMLGDGGLWTRQRCRTQQSGQLCVRRPACSLAARSQAGGHWSASFR